MHSSGWTPGDASARVRALDDESFFADIVSGADRFQSHAQSYYADAHRRPPLYRWRDGSWLVTSYDIASAALRDVRLTFGGCQAPRTPAMGRLASDWLELSSGERHRAGRRATSRAIAAGGADALPQAAVTRRLDRLAGAAAGDEVDLVPAMLHPLWLDLVQTWLGLPLQPLLSLREEITAVSRALNDPRKDCDAEPAATRLLATIDQVATDAYEGNGRGVLAACTAGEGTERSSVRILNLHTDAAPAAAAIGLCINALVTDRTLHAAVTAPHSELDHVVSELLRLDPPQVLIPRVAIEPMTIANHSLSRGDRVAVVVGAANRDRAHFAPSAALDQPHGTAPLTFGFGPHACLGRVDTLGIVTTAVRGFFDRFPDARLAAEPTWFTETSLRCHASLPVSLRHT